MRAGTLLSAAALALCYVFYEMKNNASLRKCTHKKKVEKEQLMFHRLLWCSDRVMADFHVEHVEIIFYTYIAAGGTLI